MVSHPFVRTRHHDNTASKQGLTDFLGTRSIHTIGFAWSKPISDDGVLERPLMDNAPKCAVSGKRKYSTEGAALATAKHQVATADAPMDLRAYRCDWCHAWHLTKKTEKPGRDHK